MTNRIPPSLNWLIDKRARLDGQIIKTKKALSRVEHLIEKLKVLYESLPASEKAVYKATSQTRYDMAVKYFESQGFKVKQLAIVVK